MTTGRAHNGACELHYDTFGDPGDPTLLLVNGLGSQCTNYKDAWCQMFAARGFQVIRFDNRDVGLSTSFAGAPVDDKNACYRLSDMADDAFAVLDANGVQRAHVMGLSMGGMIVQTMAIEHPERILSMTSVMSNTGEPEYMKSSPEAYALLTGPPPTDRESAIERYVAGMRVYGSTVRRRRGAVAGRCRCGVRPVVHPGRHGPPVLRRRGVRVAGRRAAPARRPDARHPRLRRHARRPDRRPPHRRAHPGRPLRAHRGHGPRLPTADLGALGRPRDRARPGRRRGGSMTAADIEFLGIRIPEGGGPATLPVTTALCTPFGWLYGGSGVAACSVAAEAATRRPLVWITTQYVANARPGEVVELAVDVVVEGHATSQTHVHGTVDGRTVLHATTAHTDRRPASCTGGARCPGLTTRGGHSRSCCRSSTWPTTPSSTGWSATSSPRCRRWRRRGGPRCGSGSPGWPIGSPASQGFVADIIPMALALALGRQPGGTSLDNTVRIVLDEPTDDWILLDIEAEGMHRSIGCGRVRLWRRDGTLIGVGTQSAIIRTSHHTPAGSVGACASRASTTSCSTSPTSRGRWPGGATCSVSSRCASRSGAAARSRSCRCASRPARSSTCSPASAAARTSTTSPCRSTTPTSTRSPRPGASTSPRAARAVRGDGPGPRRLRPRPRRQRDRAAHLPLTSRRSRPCSPVPRSGRLRTGSKGDRWSRSRASSPSSPAAAPAWVASSRGSSPPRDVTSPSATCRRRTWPTPSPRARPSRPTPR